MNSRGLTLLEMSITLAIMVLIVGMLLPFAMAGSSADIDATTEELNRIRSAIRHSYHDNGVLPANTGAFTSLGGSPPYISSLSTDTVDDWTKDPWFNAYIYDPLTGDPVRCTVRSFGPDGATGGGDDITCTVNVNDIRMRRAQVRTAEALADINNAIGIYYEFYWENGTMLTDTATTSYPTLHTELSNAGITLLPAAAPDQRYTVDGLGVAFEIDSATVNGGLGVRIQSTSWLNGVVAPW